MQSFALQICRFLNIQLNKTHAQQNSIKAKLLLEKFPIEKSACVFAIYYRIMQLKVFKYTFWP